MGGGVSTSKLQDLNKEQVAYYVSEIPIVGIYKSLFTDNDINGFDLSLLKDEDEMKTFLIDLGVTNSVHRIKLAAVLFRLKQSSMDNFKSIKSEVIEQQDEYSKQGDGDGFYYTTQGGELLKKNDVPMVHSAGFDELLQWDAYAIADFAEQILGAYYSKFFRNHRDLFTRSNVTGEFLSKFETPLSMGAYFSSIGFNDTFHNEILAGNIFRKLAVTTVVVETDTSTAIDFPKEGLTVGAIVDFVESCGGRAKFKGLTTTDVNNMFLKPLTYLMRESYCDHLRSQHSEKVGLAQKFVSHAWSYLFLDVLDALMYQFRDEPNVLLWFDIFSQNQHAAQDLDYEWWSSTFQSAIKMFGHTIMILSPWEDPKPLTRAWCLFEVLSTILTNSKFSIAMSKREKDAFLTAILESCDDAIGAMLGKIDTRNSQAFKQEDREHIFREVEKIGFGKVNSLIFELLRDWVIDTTLEALEDCTDAIKRTDIQIALGELYFGQGKYDAAMAQYQSSYEARKAALGQRDPKTIRANFKMGIVHGSKGNPVALQIYESCYNLQMELLGEKHKHTLDSMHHLAIRLRTNKKYAQAIELFKKCLENRTEVLGEGNAQTLKTMNEYALCYKVQNHFAEAETMNLKCMELQKRYLGLRHPDTVLNMSDLGIIYKVQKKYDAAEAIYKECLDIRMEVLGEKNPQTLSSMNNFGLLYKAIGKTKEAEYFLERCLVIRAEVLGKSHPATRYSLEYYVGLLRELKRTEDAKKYESLYSG